MTPSALKRSCRPIQERGYFIKRPAEGGTGFRHIFCGEHDIEGGVCPNCRKPLFRYLQLDTRDDRLVFDKPPWETIDLLYCWRCAVAQQTFVYRIIEKNSVEILKYGHGPVENGFPFEDYPDAFPGYAAELHAISPRVQETIKKLNAGVLEFTNLADDESWIEVPAHQVGGEPLLVQGGLDEVDCPSCGRCMTLLASFGDESTDPRGFVGNDYVQVLFYYCVDCFVVGAVQRCD